MATTTPNFGWSVPTSTDLVKDGATAIETLGDSIDASLVDLKGGTTNQVLAKNSNTDMDFKWVADAAGMTNPMTTTGDTIYSSSGSTPARLGIGTAGQVLTVNSGATAPEWATAPTGGMTLISTTTLGSTATTISSIPGTYNNLVMVLRNAITGGVANFHTRYNSDTGSNYIVTGSNSGSSPNVGTEYAWNQNGNPETASTPMTAIQTIYDYANTSAGAGKYIQTFYTVKNGASSYALGNVIGAWRSTSAITSITLTTIGGTTMSGTALLYGVK
jgi:hypothetical protein